MAARPVWTGTISFGMVSIPIRLVPAVRRKNITFNRIDDRTLARMRRREVSELTGEEVPSEHIAKGFDLGGGRYLVVTDDDHVHRRIPCAAVNRCTEPARATGRAPFARAGRKN